MTRFSLLKTIVACGAVIGAQNLWAEGFEFDRAGQALGTGIVPKGQVAWEQALPSISYDEFRENGVKHQHLTLQADALLRIGVGSDLEVRLGWDGPVWQRHKIGQEQQEVDGIGDMQIGLKKAIDLNDDKLTWALLAQVNLATGDDEFSSDDEIYTVGSALSYQFSQDITTAMTMLYDYQDGNLAVTAIPSIEYPISAKVTGFSEYVFRKAEHQHYQSVVNTGLMWDVMDQLQLDASVGYSFNRQQPQFNAGFGVSYLF